MLIYLIHTRTFSEHTVCTLYSIFPMASRILVAIKCIIIKIFCGRGICLCHYYATLCQVWYHHWTRGHALAQRSKVY